MNLSACGNFWIFLGGRTAHIYESTVLCNWHQLTLHRSAPVQPAQSSDQCKCQTAARRSLRAVEKLERLSSSQFVWVHCHHPHVRLKVLLSSQTLNVLTPPGLMPWKQWKDAQRSLGPDHSEDGGPDGFEAYWGATSKERAETTPGKDLPELLRSSKTWRVVSSHRWRSLWVFFVVAVLPMVNVWSRWSQCKLRNAASRRILRIVPTTSRSLSLKYVMICVDTSWSIVFYCMLLWYIVIICCFTIMPSHAEQCPWSGSDKSKWDRQKHDMLWHAPYSRRSDPKACYLCMQSVLIFVSWLLC